ncbi:hypothetical protein M0R45_029627 [Rubus argutus]|uniref:Helicase C-terminal domain-containing protein n=1 Tax=Rubus argutus TaxID=59490 RepID=A0AAW1WAR8_RUBAR
MPDLIGVILTLESLIFSMCFCFLLHSMTYIVRDFISRVVQDKNELFVKKEELSLVAVKQYVQGSKDSAKMLHKQLRDDGYEVTNVYDALTPEHRDKTVKEFRDGYTQVLIATDMLARGFDVASKLTVLSIMIFQSSIKLRLGPEQLRSLIMRCT